MTSSTVMQIRVFTIVLAGLLLLPGLLAQESEAGGAAKWDVTEARGTTRILDFQTEEGTWMSVDVSHDGRWVVFDLLGHVYRVSRGRSCLPDAGQRGGGQLPSSILARRGDDRVHLGPFRSGQPLADGGRRI